MRVVEGMGHYLRFATFGSLNQFAATLQHPLNGFKTLGFGHNAQPSTLNFAIGNVACLVDGVVGQIAKVNKIGENFVLTGKVLHIIVIAPNINIYSLFPL